MMVRSNNYRLKGVVDDLEEALSFVEDSYNRMTTAKVEDINSFRRLFKADVVDVFKVLESYVAYALKSNGIVVSDLTVREAMEFSSKLGFISDSLFNTMCKHKIIRDKYSHHYGKPSIQDFIKFYTSSREELFLLLKKLQKEVNESENVNFKEN